ncbi:MAG: biopolymer transporter ExbD [Desulfobacteraceae bacterium]|nr:biopolymer transporter ExbD [Desulfobacteraceae bacterium]MCF8095033.1 biopolymer transporter ExbD [Desulfobacteraceae bacterium]
MLIHRKKRERYRMQAPLTPLIDIVFMLLVYFLLTANFIAESGIDVNLPESEASASQTEEKITVYVDEKGLIYIGENQVELNSLQDRLQARLRGSRDSLVMIKADQSADLQKVVNVMDVSRAAGAGRLFLATQRTGDKG